MDYKQTVINAFTKLLSGELLTEEETDTVKEYLISRYLFQHSGETMVSEINSTEPAKMMELLHNCILSDIDYSLAIRLGY